MTLGTLLDTGTAVFAFLAAVFWFLSAAKKLPPMVTYWDSAPETDPFFVAVRFSAKMNTRAALFSGLSALCAFGSVIARYVH
jgi:hypothetical protein